MAYTFSEASVRNKCFLTVIVLCELVVVVLSTIGIISVYVSLYFINDTYSRPSVDKPGPRSRSEVLMTYPMVAFLIFGFVSTVIYLILLRWFNSLVLGIYQGNLDDLNKWMYARGSMIIYILAGFATGVIFQFDLPVRIILLGSIIYGAVSWAVVKFHFDVGKAIEANAAAKELSKKTELVDVV